MIARVIFITLVIMGLSLVWRGRESAGGRAAKRMVLVIFAGLVVFTILFPSVTTVVANWIGLGRGSDLVFYLTSFAFMLFAALVYIEFQKLEDRVAELARTQALHDWQSPGHDLGADEPQAPMRDHQPPEGTT